MGKAQASPYTCPGCSMCVFRIVGLPVLVMHGACIEWIECPSPSLVPLRYLLAYPTVSSSTIPQSLCWRSLYSLFPSLTRFRIPTKLMHSQIPSFLLPSPISPCYHAEMIPGLRAPAALLCSSLLHPRFQCQQEESTPGIICLCACVRVCMALCVCGG